jgi:protein-tyrosine phosphatase
MPADETEDQGEVAEGRARMSWPIGAAPGPTGLTDVHAIVLGSCTPPDGRADSARAGKASSQEETGRTAAMRFVDVHSHVVPSGDDGAADVHEGRALCVGAARCGTRLLFATPHVWPQLPLTPEREAWVRRAFAEVAAGVGLELRLGFELTPLPELLDEDPWRYELQGTGAVLMEVPFTGRTDLLVALAEHAEAAGLVPVIAHPERAEAVLDEPRLTERLAERGWLLQVNATSLLGRHGAEAEAIAWGLLEDGAARLVASDGHRPARPPHLDEAFACVRARLGEAVALPLFDGSALGLALAPAGSRSGVVRRA